MRESLGRAAARDERGTPPAGAPATEGHRRARSPRARHALALLVLAGCASVDPEEDFERARTHIRASTGHAKVFDPQAAPLAPGEIERVLADGLTLDEALRLALLEFAAWYNTHWLVARHGHRTPAQIRADQQPAMDQAA